LFSHQHSEHATEGPEQQVSVLNFGAVNPSTQAINSEHPPQALRGSDLPLRSEQEEQVNEEAEDETLSQNQMEA